MGAGSHLNHRKNVYLQLPKIWTASSRKSVAAFVCVRSTSFGNHGQPCPDSGTMSVPTVCATTRKSLPVLRHRSSPEAGPLGVTQPRMRALCEPFKLLSETDSAHHLSKAALWSKERDPLQCTKTGTEAYFLLSLIYWRCAIRSDWISIS